LLRDFEFGRAPGTVLFEPGEGAVSGYRNLRSARIVAAR
jgi:hypothetical protein